MQPASRAWTVVLCLVLALVPASAQWSEVKLSSSSPAAGDSFGDSVALAGETAAVGAPFESPEGSVRVLGRNQGGANAWGEVKILLPLNPSFGFGDSVALAADLLAVGAPFEGGSGAIHFFERDQGGPDSWGPVGQVTLPGFACCWMSLDLDGDTAVAGLPFEPGILERGIAYVYERDQGGPNAWGLVTSLTASDSQDHLNFGWSVTIDRDTIVVGAPATSIAPSSGAAYVYERDHGGAGAWGEVVKLTPCDGQVGDRFGTAVSLSGNTLAVGSPFDDDNGDASGSAYVFERDGIDAGGWSGLAQAKLLASDGTAADRLGSSVCVSPDEQCVLAGAPEHSGSAGAVYLYERHFGGPEAWGQSKKHVASDGDGNDAYGSSCAIWEGSILTGAPADDQLGLDAGAAYLEEREGVSTYCTAGTSASGCTAAIHASGLPSASTPSGFYLTATGVEGAKDGLFFFGTNGQQANPWGNGTSYQCVVPPVHRGGLLVGRGIPGACGGSFSQDLNALWCPTCPKPNHNPGAGAVVQAQLWYRDPQSTSNQTTSLSDAIEFLAGP